MITRSALKIPIRVYLTIMTLLIFFYSCRKESSPENLKIQDQQRIQKWYNSNINLGKQNPFSALSPIWDQVQVTEVGGQIVYEINMENPKKIFIGYENTDKKKAGEYFARNDTRLLIFENKESGLIVNGCYMSIVNTGTKNSVKSVRYKTPGDLTGNIYYFNPDGTLANGWAYRDGATLNKISASTETAYTAMKRNRLDELNENENNGVSTAKYEPAYCVAEYLIIYGTSCVGVDGHMSCTQYVVSREYLNNCNYGGGGSEDGGYTPPKPGGGGTSGSSSALRELNSDSLKKKYPCADKLILRPILNSPSMSEFVKPFLTPQKPSITYVTAPLTWGDPIKGGIFELGHRGDDPTSGSGLSSIVTFNEKMLDNSSPLFIAVTTVHETLHGFINFNSSYHDNYVKNNPVDFNWMAALNGFYLTKDLPPNYSHHTMMLTDYFDKAVGVITAWDQTQSTKHTNKEIAMAMMYGLNTIDPATPKAFIDNINKVFDAMKKKHGVTDADLNTFHKKNLNSPTKLPTTGCQ